MAKCGKGKVAVTVKCGEATKPPHTDEVNPGTCSRVKVFCLAPGEAAPDWACWQHIPRYQTAYKPREFLNCADAAAKLKEDAKNKVAAATTEYLIKDSPTTSYSGKEGNYTCTATPHWSFDREKMVINLPQYSWPNMTDAEKAAVQKVLDALRVHEEGHVTIVEEYVAEIAGKKTSISGSGPTQAAARDACKKNLTQYEAGIFDEQRKRQKAYDEKTGSGTKQSEVGGEDAQLVCP